MQEILLWISKHWVELLSALGIGGSGGYLGMKSAGIRRDKKIEALDNNLKKLEMEVLNIKNDVSTNTRFDEEFRGQVAKDYQNIKEEIAAMNARVEKILGYLLNMKK